MHARTPRPLMIGICVGFLVLALSLWWRARPVATKPEPSGGIIVVPSQATIVSAPTPSAPETANPIFGNAEAAADAAAIEPYRLVVRRALGLNASAVFHGITVVNPQQHIICGEVSKATGGSSQRFVYLGSASIAALDDGSADFKEMQMGACGKAVR